MQSLDIAVLIGRFEPFHNGHLGLLRSALAIAPRVVVIIGSSHQARSPRNPFSTQERRHLIEASLAPAEAARIRFLPLRDYWDTHSWASAVSQAVASVAQDAHVALVGYRKDIDTGAYLDRFPEWDFVGLPRQGDIDATVIRRSLLGNGTLEDVARFLPPAALAWLRSWSRTPACEELRQEWRALEEDRLQRNAERSCAVDTLVRTETSILLIRRGIRPGKGLWALPGILLDAPEDRLKTARASVHAETGIALDDLLPEDVRTFSHPSRSLRGNIETHVHLFRLPEERPTHSGSGAAEARWIPIDTVSSLEESFFEDHHHILCGLLGIGKGEP